MTIQMNVCETCGDGKFTVTHHEAAHRCPVCGMVERLEEAEKEHKELEDLGDELAKAEKKVDDLQDEVNALERDKERLEDKVFELKEQVDELEAKVKELEAAQ